MPRCDLADLTARRFLRSANFEQCSNFIEGESKAPGAANEPECALFVYPIHPPSTSGTRRVGKHSDLLIVSDRLDIHACLAG